MPGMHHIDKRKRKSDKKLEPFPHPHPWIKFLDNFLIIVAIIAPLMTIPQIYTIFVFKDASGVSALTFALLALFNIPWIIYGFIHKTKPIIVTYIIWFIVNTTIFIGALIY